MTMATGWLKKCWRLGWRVLVALAILGFVGILALDFLASQPLRVRATATQSLIRGLGAGLEAFKIDWGMYPPSGKRLDGAHAPYGYQNLTHYLMGPAGEGWGTPTHGRGPFGGTVPNTFGPYFETESGGPADGVRDAWGSPPRYILYFRFDAGRDPPYAVRDNPVDPTCRHGFANQEHFELSAKRKDPKGGMGWVREDYLLISPGSDRLYGYVVVPAAGGEASPARPEDITQGKATCDDIVNGE